MAANRLLKDWRNSDKVNSLTVHSERFFVRLIMTVDDYGCFYADPRLLRVNLFPLLIDSIREADLIRWMAECQKAGLIVLYESDNKKYVQILNFGQRLRQKTTKFPLPISYESSAECPQDVRTLQHEVEVEVEVEEKLKEKGNAGKPDKQTTIFNDQQKNSFSTFEKWIHDNAPNVAKMKEPFTIEQYLVLVKDFTGESIKDLLMKMHNYVPLLKKNNSANLTFRNWSKRDYNTESTEPIKNTKLSDAVKMIENGQN